LLSYRLMARITKMENEIPITLLIEDNPEDARLFEELLKEGTKGSYRLVQADRLSRGLEHLAAEKFDAVFVDLGLPDSKGLHTLKAVTKNAVHLPIIVITGLDDETTAIAALQNGAQDYLIKGRIDGHVLWRVLTYSIERKGSEDKLRKSEKQYRLLADYHQRLNDISLTFGEAVDTADLFSKIAESLRLLTGAIASSFAVYDQEARALKVMSLSIDPISRDNVISMFGTDLFKLQIPIGTDDMEQMLIQSIRRPQDLHELSSGQLPKDISDSVMDFIGCQQIVALAISYAGEIIGTCVAYLRGDQPVVPDEALKTYINLSALAIKRKRVEESLLKSEELFRVAQEMSPDGFTILHPLRNEKGEIIDFTWVYENKAIARINGTDPEEIKGKRVLDLFPTHKGTPIFEAYIYVSNSGKPQIIGEVYVGEIVSRPTWLRLVIVSIGGDIAIHAEDITERKLAEELLRGSESRYRLLAAHTTDVVRLLDMDLKTTYLSPSAEKLRGFTLQEMVEMPLESQLTPESLRTAYAILSEEISRVESDPAYNPIFTLDIEYYHKDGTTIWTESKFSLIRDENGRPVSILAEARDISERKRAEDKLANSYESLKKTLNDAINTMVKIVETRDPYTAGHQHKAADLAIAIAGEMKLENARIDQLKTAAIIHDIGKMYVPSDILSKPGKLSDMEFSLIKTHAQAGFDIVKGMNLPCNIAKTVLQHHERLDGSGYPNHLKGDDTLLEAKILAVADVIEAMASHRPYRPALGIDKALEEISKNKGKLYDPDAVDACLELFKSGRYEFKLV